MPNQTQSLHPHTVPDTTDGFTGDTLAAVPTVEIAVRSLRSGMVLVDPDLHTPEAVIDHRNRSAPRSGSQRFLVLDLDRKRHTEVVLTTNATVLVMADSVK